MEKKEGEVIGIISLKGGVGKTSSVICLGDAISKFGKKVLLIDGNTSSSGLGIYLNIIDSKVTLNDVLNNKKDIEEAIINMDNFDIITSKFYTKDSVNSLKLKDKIKKLKKKYDYIIIDSAPSLNEETLAVMLASDKVIMITTPDLPTLGATIKSIKLAKQRGISINGIILNKVYRKKFELSLKDIQNSSGVPILAVIPHDVNFLKAVSQFRSYVSIKPSLEGSEEFKKIAATIMGEKYKSIKLKSFFRWLSPKEQDINRLIFYERVFKD
jgi:septum site-determining protein MinD